MACRYDGRPGPDGRVGHVIPDLLSEEPASSAWGDAAAICPWELYLAYGNKELLSSQFTLMKKWISYISTHTETEYLWTGGTHYGDWLGLDAPSGSYKALRGRISSLPLSMPIPLHW